MSELWTQELVTKLAHTSTLFVFGLADSLGKMQNPFTPIEPHLTSAVRSFYQNVNLALFSGQAELRTQLWLDGMLAFTRPEHVRQKVLRLVGVHI